MKYIFGFTLLILIGCSTSNSNDATSNASPEKASDEASITTENVEENQPQSKEDRIADIKKWYGQIQNMKVKPDCVEKTSTTYDGLMEDQKFPFDNIARSCSTKTEFRTKQVELNGYEWYENTYFYYKGDELFFAFLEGGAESCFYEYRVYYGKDGEVIRILSAENNCGGDDVLGSKEVTNTQKGEEIVQVIQSAMSECNSILAQ